MTIDTPVLHGAMSRHRSRMCGTTPVPNRVRVEIERLEATTAEAVDQMCRHLEEARDFEVRTFRRDAEVPEFGGIQWPAAWHRAVCARVAQQISGLVIRFAP
ncbi:hypothetical protein [Rhodococcus marinonascens]|uniref:hypothetical protein n=1 Tax=Rhodococcus marinonascens TaxID=38311 RepID=UPI00111501C2|nr:hypothetical protein [Rhodococcus marinonascens]